MKLSLAGFFFCSCTKREANQENDNNVDQTRHFVTLTGPLCASKIESTDDLLVKRVIPSKSKASLIQMLNLSGISRAYLFPDLTNLAHELSNVSYIDKKTAPQ